VRAFVVAGVGSIIASCVYSYFIVSISISPQSQTATVRGAIGLSAQGNIPTRIGGDFSLLCNRK